MHHEHTALQQTSLREKTLEGSIFDLRQFAHNVPGSRSGGGGGRYFIEECAEPRPLFMCPGDPGGSNDGGAMAVAVSQGASCGDIATMAQTATCQVMMSNGRMRANMVLSPLESCKNLRNSSVDQIADLYWAMRRVVRRYRAAKGKFGPRKLHKGSRIRRRFRKGSGKGKRRRVLYVVDAFV